MIVDRRQIEVGRRWTAVIAAAVAGRVRRRTSSMSPNGPRGGSCDGAVFCGAWHRDHRFRVPSGPPQAVSRRRASAASRPGSRAHVWLGLLSFLLILMHSGLPMGTRAGRRADVAVRRDPGQRDLRRRAAELAAAPHDGAGRRTRRSSSRSRPSSAACASRPTSGWSSSPPISGSTTRGRAGPRRRREAVLRSGAEEVRRREKVQAVVERRKTAPQIEVDEDSREALRAHYLAGNPAVPDGLAGGVPSQTLRARRSASRRTSGT